MFKLIFFKYHNYSLREEWDRINTGLRKRKTGLTNRMLHNNRQIPPLFKQEECKFKFKLFKIKK